MKKNLVTAAVVLGLGILTFTGCSGQEAQGNDQEAAGVLDITMNAGGNQEDFGTDEADNPENFRTDGENNPESAGGEADDNQENPEGDPGAISGDSGGEAGDGEVASAAGGKDPGSNTESGSQGEMVGGEADSFYMSADISGNVQSFSETGCSIYAVRYVSDEIGEIRKNSDTVTTSRGGEEELPVEIIYGDDIKFLSGYFKSDGSTYSTEEADKSDIAKHSTLLVFGNLQEDGSYLASEIVLVHFT